MTALCNAAPARGGIGPDRIGPTPCFAMASSSASTSSTNQHFVHEYVNIGKRTPRARRGLCRLGGGSHVRPSTVLIYGDWVGCSPFRAPQAIQSVVVIEAAPTQSSTPSSAPPKAPLRSWSCYLNGRPVRRRAGIESLILVRRAPESQPIGRSLPPGHSQPVH